MVNYRTFDKCIIGGSHVKEGKVCQDHSGHYSDERMCIGIVADGHGSADYFRSDIGSYLAVEVAKRALIDATNYMLDKMTPAELGRQISEYGKGNGQNRTPDCFLDIIKERIVQGWRASVDLHFKGNPFTEADLEKVQKKYVDRLNNQGIYYWAYGTTLIASVVTEGFWYAIQVGDGNCVAVYTEENKGGLTQFVEDMPRDPFVGEGEATTSMCQANVIEGFRHYASYTLPKMILVHSDGIDDSLLDDATRQGVYFNVGGSFAKGELWAEENIETAILTNIANNWKGDDTSMAVTYIAEGLEPIAAKLFEVAQRRQSENNYKRAKARVEELENAVKGLTATIAQEEAQIAEAKRRFSDKGDEFKRANLEIEECGRKIKELEARIEAIKKQREQIKLQGEQIKTRGVQVETLKKSNMEILETKRKELEALRAKVTDYEKKNGIGQRGGLGGFLEGVGNKFKELFGSNGGDQGGYDQPIPVVEPVSTEPQPTTEPVAQPETTPVAEPEVQPTVEPVAQHEAISAEEPTAQPEPTPVVEPAIEPTPVVEPVAVPTPEAGADEPIAFGTDEASSEREANVTFKKLPGVDDEPYVCVKPDNNAPKPPKA